MNNEVYTVELIQTIGVVLYKFLSLAVGMFTTYLGYQLFLKGFLTETGELEGKVGTVTINLRKAAPGIFFALFGTVVISYCIFKDLEFDVSQKSGATTTKTATLSQADSSLLKDTVVHLPSEPPK